MDTVKTAYFDLFSGVSGDMIVGALIDAGADVAEIQASLESLVPGQVTVSAERVERKGIAGTRFVVNTAAGGDPRSYKLIRELFQSADMDPEVKETCLKIFLDMARAEGKVHGVDPEEVHFHEVGALDSIADIVGAAVCMENLGIHAVYASRVHVGRGVIECCHGKLPVPAPATMELLRGVPVYSTGISEEIVTPTGAAVIRNMAGGFGDMPEMVVERTAYGAGTKTLDLPNLLRAVIGERHEE